MRILKRFPRRADWLTYPRPAKKGVAAARLFWFLAALAACAVAFGDIEVKPQYDDHEPIVPTVTVPGMPPGAVFRKAKFKIPGATVIPVDESTFHVWAPPGKYTIEATGTWRLYQTIVDKQDKEWKVIADEDDYEFTAKFSVGPEVPVPPPFPPKPDPPIPPKPGGPYQILLLYDADQLDNLPADQRALLTSLVYRQKLTAAGHRVLGVLAAQTINPANASKFKAFFDAVKDDPLPRIAIAKLDGGKVADFPLPTSVADLEKLLATEVIP